MHEYSIVSALLERADGEARARHAIAVHRLTVRIGDGAGVDRDLLAKAFEHVRAGTICSHAELRVECVRERWDCPVCGRTLERGAALSCEQCGMPARLIAGDEIILERIEMEVP
ncbi:MAG TPA: hydrogenase maturation nickel metallochaperone HypA [Candidatus Binataceae bacterium]|nr:hydrogenase maturation nickel metallochaperone HypA [Candidatus Binataceae bacterium]